MKVISVIYFISYADFYFLLSMNTFHLFVKSLNFYDHFLQIYLFLF